MYLIDPDVLIQAKNRHYGFDFCPAFWEWLDKTSVNGLVGSVSAVQGELIDGNDDLANWAKERDRFFLSPDEAVLDALSNAIEWATDNYEAPGPGNFAAAADSLLVAHAATRGHVVVSQEQPANSPRKIKIPNACQALGVEHIDVFDLLRRESALFVL